jgi:hypothetical protein
MVARQDPALTGQSPTLRLGFLERVGSEQEPPAVGEVAIEQTLTFRAVRLAMKSKFTIHLPVILAE